MDAVVMAAGEGERMRPLTERWPKPILPIDGRPVIVALLRELAGAGFPKATVVTGHLAERVEALVGDGAALGLAVSYVRQPEALGSADAVRRALEAGAQAPLLVSAADTVYTPGDIKRAADEWTASGTIGGLAVRPLRDKPEASPVLAENGRLVALEEGDPRELAAAPLWFLSAALCEAVANVPGPPFEIAEAFRRILAAGHEIAALEIGPTRDVTRPTDVILRNFPYLWTQE